ncbi:THAP domain-containing protein 10-like [Saccostrea echinata]|uniref:THAP domain-containing protein 10-like n=1 Tax=Saccostrea echinata TaxID=191078 RepID=UPI002A810101|nr:THAP domain-containing protein 10-like [Saccostrea echinata]
MASKSVGRMCVVAGCSKRQSDGVSVHVFPKDERLRAAWCRFVKLTRADWSGPSKYTVICSDHFNEDCYEVHFSLMKDFGIPAKKRPRQGSIPSIYPKRKRDQLNDAFLESPHVTYMARN